MDPDNIPTYLGTTVIGIDSDGGVSNDVPAWLRDFIGRALTARGIRTKRKVASEEAIESLSRVDFDSLKEKDCPICYDAYEKPLHENKVPNVLNHGHMSTQPEVKPIIKPELEKIISEDKRLNKTLVEDYNIRSVEPVEDKLKFKDPALFLATDEGAVGYFRFPQRNLISMQNISDEDMFPGFFDEENTKKEKKRKLQEFKSEGHIPVKMPSCDHIFGKTCIVEWLKANVSCPLCRSEVEALVEEGPQVKRLREIQTNSTYNFNDQDPSDQHILMHSTDVFNPYRRPFNPLVTPLTDSFMLQDWATPYDGTSGRVNTRDPSLILPRRFPFPEPSLLRRGRSSLIGRDDERPRIDLPHGPDGNVIPLRGRFTGSNNNNNNNNNNNTASSNINNNNTNVDNESVNENGAQDSDSMNLSDDQFNSPSAFDTNSMNDGEDSNDGTTSNNSQTRSNTARPLSTGSLPRWSTRLRGSDRNRRSSPSVRSHPYSRPQSEE
ncbi:hypothetical protein DFJ63DRAFT_336789 [Scheffersomyces coipomensis]|uniref:uncharacterized protein n=1 Tax=Scheffersomyces coipomensis TaxID=1788519 RepID=UPI00315C8D3C